MLYRSDSDQFSKSTAANRYALRRLLSIACALLVLSGAFATAAVEGSNQKRAKKISSRKTPSSRAARARKNRKAEHRKTEYRKTEYRKTEQRRIAPALLPGELADELAAELNEDPEGRDDWFFFQRAYPFNRLPPDARRRAWLSIKGREVGPLAAQSSTQRWQAIGPGPTRSAFMSNWGATSGRINAIAVSPASSQIVIVGSSTGGIWRSIDGGASFVSVSDDQVDLAVGAIAFSPSDPSIVYAGMGDAKLGYLGSGVLKSSDSGKSWTKVSNGSLPAPGTVTKIEVDPTNANRVYLAQYTKLSDARVTSSGFYLSTDGGTNWKRTLAGMPRDLVIHPSDRKTLYLGMIRVDEAIKSPAGVYRSTDGGASWTNIFVAPSFDETKRRDVRIAVTPAEPNKIYVLIGGVISDAIEAQLAVSADGGATWVNRGSAELDTGQFGYNTYLFAHPSKPETLYAGTRDIYKSTDGGTSWKNLTNNFTPAEDFLRYTPKASSTHPDQHAFAFSPNNPDEIYVGNDGGVSKSTDGGKSFASLNATLSLTQFTSIALHPTDPSISYGGTQDNGTQRRANQSSKWEEFVSGDGGRCVINPADPSIVFTTYIRGTVFRFFDNGFTFDNQVASNGSFDEPANGARIAFYAPFTGNGADATLYLGTWRLFIGTNLGISWSAPAGDLDLTKGITSSGKDVLSAIAVSRSNTEVIYTGSAQGRAMASADGGKTWKDITAGLPDRFISSITVDESNSAVAYLTVSGFGSGHVFKTSDMGATWTDVSGNLPDIPVNALLIDPVNPGAIYVGTDIGVFRSVAAGAMWQAFNEALPPVVVAAFSAQSSGLIQIATYGRGAYETITDGVKTAPPAISSVAFDGKKKMTIAGNRFGDNAKVIINGIDQSSRIRSNSDTVIKLKGKSNQLGLSPGDNTVAIVDSKGASSNAFVFKF